MVGYFNQCIAKIYPVPESLLTVLKIEKVA